jgi:hypothetical protein
MTDRDPLEWLIGIIGMRTLAARFVGKLQSATFYQKFG